MVAITPPAVVAVTGANGFVGTHVCAALLSAGYKVRAVVRSLERSRHLETLPGASGPLALVACADMLSEGAYDEAFVGCAAICHTAAVVEVLDATDAVNRIIRPAVDGTKNIIASARRAGVQRFVHISSVAAVQNAYAADGGEPTSTPLTEDSWNSWSDPRSDAYGYAKTLAERALWEDLEGGAAPFDAVALCPAVVLGPCYTKAHTKASAVLVREVLYNNPMNQYNATFVDARDVAAAVVAALRLSAAGVRVILCADEPPMSTVGLGPIAQEALPQYTISGIPTRATHPWAIWLLARLRLVSLYNEAMCTRKYVFSNARCKQLLGVVPRPLRETVKDTAESMVNNGFVKPKQQPGHLYYPPAASV
jgi:nucleoside-diphosphate-sugar epimerase